MEREKVLLHPNPTENDWRKRTQSVYEEEEEEQQEIKQTSVTRIFREGISDGVQQPIRRVGGRWNWHAAGFLSSVGRLRYRHGSFESTIRTV